MTRTSSLGWNCVEWGSEMVEQRASWETIWGSKGYDVKWVEELRQYVAICRHYTVRGKHESLLFAKTVQEMDKKIKAHKRWMK